jgi:hypothetical protein
MNVSLQYQTHVYRFHTRTVEPTFDVLQFKVQFQYQISSI